VDQAKLGRSGLSLEENFPAEKEHSFSATTSL